MQVYKSLVWKVLSGVPIEILDEETHSVWHGHLWELATPRSEGDYAGSRVIGTANIVAAYNLLHSKLIENGDSVDSLEIFKDVLELLASEKAIRQRPDRIRQTFKAV